MKIELRKSADINDMLEFEVTDYGIGFNQCEIQKLYKPFYMAENKHSRNLNPNGHGLGLYITRKLAKSMGGTLTLRSRRNNFTTFIVSFAAISA